MKADGYPNVTTTTDRHGTTRWRYRKHGRICYLPGHPGEQCFDDAYDKAANGSPLEGRDRETMLNRHLKPALKRARTRATRADVPFDLTEEDFERMLLDQDYRCAVSGIPFHVTKDGSPREKQAFRPSIDRIIPKLGYVRSNVRLVCEIVNLAMNNWGEEPLRLLVRRMRYFRAESGSV
jgi:hypothetical protein